MRRWLGLVALLLAGGAATAAERIVPAMPGALAGIVERGEVQAGDTLVLAPGHHGDIRLRGYRFDPPVTVRAAGAEASGLGLRETAGWRWIGLTVRPGGDGDSPLVSIRDSRHIAIESFDIASGEGVSRWSKARWLARARTGIRADGRDIRLTENRITGVDHGIEALGDAMVVEANRIAWFAGDGIRALGDGSVYRRNTIETCVDIDGNHDDGIQSWSRGPGGRSGRGVVRNVVIEGNVIRNGRAGRLTCELQGIGFFDGMFEDLTIRRNVVIVDHWHGITVMGARRVTIADNLVVDADPTRGGTPWIAITAHKDGRAATESRIVRNITHPWAGGSNAAFRQPQPGVTLDGNLVVATPEAGIALWNRENR